MRKHSLKKSKRGYTRCLGLDLRRKCPKFYLGDDKQVAKFKREKIETVWKSIESDLKNNPTPKTNKPVWTAEKLQIAKAIANNSDTTLNKLDNENATEHYKRLQTIASDISIAVKPHADDVDNYNVGKLIIGMEYRNLGK